ncbi:hypothetical protein B0J12DRAFT_789676 [Macrophomina phaseolina]|uniref:DUF7730 domain-containing protein n=1 Tax=Macrophomina phaseolina TaxID=35725 RepID=A0ABQ8FVM4_9PEZI|nr:hypothetical protein B0J12DRAFT_789676 [Macrophomina phaseolina]
MGSASSSALLDTESDEPDEEEPATETRSKLANPSRPFPFMKLPCELRLLVYKHLLGSRDVAIMRTSSIPMPRLQSKIIACKKDLPHNLDRRTKGTLENYLWKSYFLRPWKCFWCGEHPLQMGLPLEANIVKVSKLVYKEAAEVLYGTNTFCFDDGKLLACFIRSVSPLHVGMIKELRIFYSFRIYPIPPEPWASAIDSTLVQRLSKLKRLHLVNILPIFIFQLHHGLWTGECSFRGQPTGLLKGVFRDLDAFRCLGLDDVRVTIDDTSLHLYEEIHGGVDETACRLTQEDRSHYCEHMRGKILG